MYRHVYTFLKMYKHVCTWYIHICTFQMYKNVCTLVRRVCTCIYKYKRVLNFINMYIQCTNLYRQACTAAVPYSDDYVHYMKCTDIVELCTYTDVSFWFQVQLFYCPAGWPVCSDWLLLGVTPIQVQAH